MAGRRVVEGTRASGAARARAQVRGRSIGRQASHPGGSKRGRRREMAVQAEKTQACKPRQVAGKGEKFQTEEENAKVAVRAQNRRPRAETQAGEREW